MRDYLCRTAKVAKEHLTGRKCADLKCQGDLMDSIVNFGEYLPKEDMNNGLLHAEKADVLLSLGSSLRISSMFPEATVNNGGKLVVVNIQKTPLDKKAALVIHAKIDTVVERVMKNLILDIPTWTYERRMTVQFTDKNTVIFQGIDLDGKEYTFIKKAQFFIGKNRNRSFTMTKPPFEISSFGDDEDDMFEVKMAFFCWYEEPELIVKLDRKDLYKMKVLSFTFNSATNKWSEPVLKDR